MIKETQAHNMKPLVSIIVPVYNAEAYLQRCVESILAQTYENIELILVNDGSTDNSLGICQSFAEQDGRIKVVTQTNRGVAAARNTGMDTMEGEYFSFVDSDDALTENAIEILVRDALTYQGDIVSATRICVIEGEENPIAVSSNKTTLLILRGTEALEQSLDYERFTASACAKLYRSAFVKNIRFEEGRNINEDGFFVFSCCLKRPVFLYRDTCVYLYYLRQNSASRSAFSEKYFDMLYFSDKKKALIVEYFPEYIERAINMEVSTHLFFLSVLCRTDEAQYKKYEKASIRFVKENKKKYRTKHAFEQRMVKIVSYGMFPLYKFLLRLFKKV